MKGLSWFAAIYAVFAILVFRTADSISQTLAPVGSGGFDFWPLVVVAVIAAAGFGFYLWHKRNPSAATSAVASAAATAQTDALALGHKALDLARGLRDVVDKQAAVIASPPVQAVINAPAAAPAAVTPLPPTPAPSAAPAPVAAAVAAPAPVVAAPPTLITTPVSAAADPAAPWGYTIGPNGKVANTGPDVGFGWDPFGVPMASQAVADHWKNLMNWQASRDVPSMTDAESNVVLATFDAEPDLWIKWYHISAKEQLALVNRMPNAQQARMINEYNGANGRNIGVPPGWAESACHRLRGD